MFKVKSLSQLFVFLFYRVFQILPRNLIQILIYKSIGLRKNFLKFSRMTTYDGLRSITSNDKLIAVLTGQWGDYGMPPKESSFVMHCMIANHYFDGASYPVGGSSMIANTIGSFIKKNNGYLFVNKDDACLLYTSPSPRDS